MRPLSFLRSRFTGDDSGFTLVELAVSMGILTIVSTLAVTVLISTQKLSSVIGWQSASNSELRLLIDDVFADIGTARPAFGCDTDSDGKADTLDASPTICQGDRKMVESNAPVLLVAAPNRLCYYTNRIQSRQVSATVSNPPYTPVCLAVEGTQLRLETYPVPVGDWNATISGTARVPSIRNLGTVDPSITTQGFFEYYKPKDAVGSEVKLTESVPVTVTVNGQSVADPLSDATRATISSVVVNAQVRFGSGTNAARQRTRNLTTRITLRAQRYSSERCGFGSVDAGGTCS
jgi:prepilin-type N-terminal cleavage/methylation domain-containing protein